MALPTLAVAPRPATAQVPRPQIRPRSEWATGRPPKKRPTREDVRFLLVHHTQTPNTERPASIPGRLRGMYDFHTREKDWPDLAYNFLVDPFGRIWEGRAGSLAGPVRGDATGGSQGFAQLCCFIGDHRATPPTREAMAAMTSLLAWLTVRDGVDLSEGRTVRFVSRGSNRWPRGKTVTTDPVAAHRDMSRTDCPGDALYPLVRSQLLPGARRLAAGAPARPTGASTDAATPTAAATATAATATATSTAAATATGSATTPPVTATSPPASAATTATSLAAAAAEPTSAAATTPAPSESGFTTQDALPILGVAGVAGGAALAAHLLRRS
nr:N-acetylmuramoyl-L-alanine amidase [Kineosphaera limosa]